MRRREIEEARVGKGGGRRSCIYLLFWGMSVWKERLRF